MGAFDIRVIGGPVQSSSVIPIFVIVLAIGVVAFLVRRFKLDGRFVAVIAATSVMSVLCVHAAQDLMSIQAPLPKPTLAAGERGELGIDANVDETTIDRYLGRANTRYVDVRMLDDDADWEAIGGDSRISGIVEGFSVVPYPHLAPVGELPDAVGRGYDGPTLFVEDGNGGYVPAYRESMPILRDLFPQDEDIVLMCGGGGYAGATKRLLVSLGWDENRIWDVGGWWYYEGDHGVEVAHDNGHGETTWDFHLLDYHGIDFDVLHAVDGSDDGEADVKAAAELTEGLPRLTSQAELDGVARSGNVVAYVYLPGCTACAEFAPVAAELASSGMVPTYAVSYRDLTDEKLRDMVGHAPGVLAFHDGRVVASLSADSDEDMASYRSLEALTTWLSGHLDGVEVRTGSAVAEVDCGDGCEP